MSRPLVWVLVAVAVLAALTIATELETEPAERGGARILELPGGDLRYRDQGDRDDPPVVLLHGFACSLRWWDRVAPDLVRRGRRVIRFDLLGHGGSEKPRGGYAIEEQAALIAAALRELGVRRAAVLGTAPAEGFGELPLSARLARWPVVGHLVRRLAPDQTIRAGLSSAFADGTEVPSAFVDDVDGMTYSAYRRSGSATREANEERPVAERVERSRRPLLVIFGTADEIVDPSAARVWRRRVARARVVRLRGVGHSPHWEQPREVVRELLQFTR